MSQVTDPRVEHLLHPRHPAEVLRAMFDGRETTDYPAMATQAVLLLAERDDLRQRISNARSEIAAQSVHYHVAECGTPVGHIVEQALAVVETHMVDPEYRPDAKTEGRQPVSPWAILGIDPDFSADRCEPPASAATDERRWQWAESVSWTAPGTVTIPITRRGVGGDVVMDAAQAGVLAEMLADAADQDAATEAKRAAQHAAADAIQDLTLEMTELPGGAS